MIETRYHTIHQLGRNVWSIRRDDVEQEFVFGDEDEARRRARRWDARVEAGEQTELKLD